jgi:hypothetical protein
MRRSDPQFKDFPYPPGTPDNVPHYQFAKYVHDYWKHFGLESLTTLNTRVEKAEKKEDGAWELRLRQQETTGNGDQVIESTWTDVSHRKQPHCSRLNCSISMQSLSRLGIIMRRSSLTRLGAQVGTSSSPAPSFIRKDTADPRHMPDKPS